MGNVPRSALGSFALNLDGVQCGFVKSVDGGEITADVISEPTGPSAFVKKHIGPPKYEEVVLRIGLSMAKEVYDWIRDSWALKAARKSGSILAGDANFNAKTERQFVDALITETTLPAFDAASKEQGLLTLKLAPELIRTVKASGKMPASATKQKQFQPANFRFELGNLDCTRVAKIDSFTVRQQTVDDNVGERRIVERRPGKIEFPNLRVTLAESSAQTWTKWFEDFVVNGKNGDENEKSGAIVFLDPTRKTELGRVTLKNVGIFALRRAPRTDEQVPRLIAELYCEQMELKVDAVPAAVQPTPPAPQPAPQPVRPRTIIRPDLPLPPGP